METRATHLPPPIKHSVEAICMEMRCCEAAARAQGWDGVDYELTSEDLESITDALGYLPTREEWRQAGLCWVGDAHCAKEA